MQIKITYIQKQLNQAVEYISQNNLSFLGKDDEIRESILSSMIDLAKDQELDSLATMGYILVTDKDFESIDFDENICRVEIYVDPSLNVIDDITEDDFIEKIIETDTENSNQ